MTHPLERAIGHRFADPELLGRALTHRSVSADEPDRADNERLEFLGDAVLQLVITHRLFSTRPEMPEGQLAKARAALVSQPTLAELAGHLDLGSHVELAAGEERTGGRSKESILADALEAVIGAVYLDAGLEAARDLILGLWGELIEEKAERPGVKDYKTRLQELLAATGRQPEYRTEGEGPDHARTFTSEVFIDGSRLGVGTGRSKKAAEQEAAGKAMEALRRGSR